jgi:predicted alpha-1,2-mannosidase
VARLDSLFDGGLYWHGNEPNHHIAYLYDYAGAPWKTQERVSRIRAEEYDAGPGGLSGNDDAGQMSAWYVFSALGLYPVAPGMPDYALGTPLFPEASLRVGGGKRFTIRAEGVSKRNRYIQSARLNGQPLDRAWISHEEITAGGTLVFRMGPTPNRAWASEPAAAPPSMEPAKESR